MLASEWTPDSSSAACMVCERGFTLTRRRHHCRRCGVLVCHSCSKNTLKVSGAAEERVCDGCFTTQIEKQEMKEGRLESRRRHEALLARGSHVSPNLIRVYFLDGTYKPIFYTNETTALALSAKMTSHKLAIFEVDNDIDDHTQYTFVRPDEAVIDIVARWRLGGKNFAKLVIPLYSMHRLHQDVLHETLNDEAEGKTQTPARRHSEALSPPSTSAVSMVERPSTLTSRDSIAPFLAPSIDTDATASRPVNGKRGSPARGPDLRSLSAELADLQQEHEKLKQRYEVLHRQYRRLQGMRDPGGSPRLSSVMSLAEELESNGNTTTRGSISGPMLTLPAVTDRFSFGSSGLLVRNSLGGFEEDVGPMMYLGDGDEDAGGRGRKTDMGERDSFVSRRSSRVEQTPYLRAEERRTSLVDLPPPAALGEGGGLGETRDSLATVTTGFGGTTMMGGYTPSPRRADHEALPYRVVQQGFLLKRSDYRRQWNHRYCRLCSDGVIRYNGSDGETPKGTIRLHGVHQVVRSAKPLVIVLIFSKRRLKLKAEDQESFEKWLHALQVMVSRLHAPQPPPEKEGDGSLVVEETETHVLTAKQLLRQLEEVDEVITHYDCQILETMMAKGSSDPESLIDAYEVIVKMDSLYVKLNDVGPEWYERFRHWLTSLLRGNLAVPLERAEVVAAVMRCLGNEGMLGLPTAREAVIVVLRQGLKQVSDVPTTGNGPFRTANMVLVRAQALLAFLQALVDTWIRVFPREFQLGHLVFAEVKACVATDICGPGPATDSSTTTSGDDLLSLVDWGEKVSQVVDAFEVEEMGSVFRDVQAKFLEAYCSRTRADLEELIIRLIGGQQVARQYGEKGHAVMTWPTHLQAFIEQQLQVVTARVPDKCEVVTRAILVCLPDFRARLEHQVLKINTKPQPSSEGGYTNLRLMTLAALVNDFASFAEVLTGIFHGYTTDRLTLLYESFKKDVVAFTEASQDNVRAMADIICTDLEAGLQAGLPVAWVQNVEENPMSTMESKLVATLSELQPRAPETEGESQGLLRKDAHFSLLLSTILRRLVKFYVQLLMRVKPPVDEDRRLRQRLQSDAKLLSRLFTRFDALPLSVIDDEVKPIVKVIALIDIDDVTNTGFIKTLLPVFGMATSLKLVKTTLKMRGFPKEKRDKVLEGIATVRLSGEWADKVVCNLDFNDM